MPRESKAKRIRKLKSKQMHKKKEEKKQFLHESDINKPIDRIKRDDICNKFIEDLLKRKVTKDVCPHFLIGGSGLRCFLLGGWSYQKAHSVFFTCAKNRVTGQSGEEAFLRSNPNNLCQHPFGIHPKMSWICATGDFIINEDNTDIMVEVKTFTDYKRACDFRKKPGNRALMQIWTQLEIFGLCYGRIMVYFLDTNSKTVILIGKIEIKRTATIFNHDLILLSVVRYIDFLEEFFVKNNMNPTSDFMKKLKFRLADNMLRSMKDEVIESKIWFKRIINRPVNHACSFFENNTQQLDKFDDFKIIQYNNMFENHKFRNTSKVVSYIEFDEVEKEKMILNIFSKLGEYAKDSVSDLKNKITTGLKLEDLITQEKLGQVDETIQNSKQDELKISNQKNKEYLFRLKKKDRQIKILKARVRRLERIIREKKVSNKLNLVQIKDEVGKEHKSDLLSSCTSLDQIKGETHILKRKMINALDSKENTE